MPIALTVTEGPHQGRVFTFRDHDMFLVGRSPDAHFCLPERDPYFSRVHFMVEVNPPLCRLVDMGGRNGTFVNGQRVSAVDLHDGDRIQGGATTLRVSLVPESDSMPATLSQPAPARAAPSDATPPLPAPYATRGTVPSPSTLPPPLPSVPGYRVERVLGKGGMGVVYLARREPDGSLAAVKMLRPAVQGSEQAVGRFLREADILRGLRHPHIVAFRETGRAGHLLYFVMEYVPGRSAGELLQAEGPLPVRRAVGLTCQVLEAMAHAHGRGFVHRDIKPGNVLVAQERGREVAKLADFGLARTYQASPLSGLTMTATAGGTPAFMPPEQVLDFRSVKPAADQYAAAATLYHLLTAKVLFDGVVNAADLFLRILQKDPVPLRQRRPDVPEAVAAAVHRALARKPEGRFADVGTLRQILLPFGRA
jgi:serine/threonine-protein kinase